MTWWNSLFRKNVRDAQLDSELRFHIEELADANIAAGMSPQEARRQAQLEFGGREQIKEELREVYRVRIVDSTTANLKSACRFIRKSPSFSIAVILTFALAIGANSAVFSAIDAILLRPLPGVERASEVVSLNEKLGGAALPLLSYPDYRDYRDGNRSFDGLMAASLTSFGFKPDASALPKVTYGMYVSGNFFRVLGVQPALGRGFLESEDQAVGRDAVVVLGHDYWVSQFNANPSIVGSTIWINNIPCNVIGVTPQEFTGIDQFIKPSMFVPFAMSARLGGGENVLEKRDLRWLTVKGRLKPGVGIAQASADLTGIATRLEQMYPFPSSGVQAILSRYPSLAEVVWVQEEPRNMGAWRFVQEQMEPILEPYRRVLRYIGRPESASTSSGSLKRHQEEQAELVESSFAAEIKSPVRKRRTARRKR